MGADQGGAAEQRGAKESLRAKSPGHSDTRLGEAIWRAPDVARVFVREALNSANAADSGLASIGVGETFAQVLEYGQARGEVRIDIPVELTSRYLTALHAYLLHRLLGEVTAEEAEQEIARLSAFVMGGLSVRGQ